MRNNDIVVSKTDKNGKLIIIDLPTYNNIMKRELEQFQELNISQNDFEKKVAMVRKKCENFAITILHKKQVMDNNLLYHTAGLKIADGQYHKVKGPKAKEFCNNTPAYIYPLFKTHKFKPELLESTSPE